MYFSFQVYLAAFEFRNVIYILSIEGKTICQKTFLITHGIGRTTFTKLTKHYKDVGVVPRDRLTRGLNNKRMAMNDSMQTISYLQNRSIVHCVGLPGRVPGMLHPIFVVIGGRLIQILCMEIPHVASMDLFIWMTFGLHEGRGKGASLFYDSRRHM